MESGTDLDAMEKWACAIALLSIIYVLICIHLVKLVKIYTKFGTRGMSLLSDRRVIYFNCLHTVMWTGIAQSVWRLYTGWTVRGSNLLIPVADRFKAKVCGRSLAELAGSNPAEGTDVCMVCCK